MNTANHISFRALPQSQRGMATLLISLVILTTITFTLIYTARTVLQEQAVTANDLRGRQAFEAAEAGQEAAVAYIMTAGGRDKDNDGNIDAVYDTDGDGVGDSNTTTLPNGSKITVTMNDASISTSTASYVATEIITQGWSDDETATRTIDHVYSYVSPLPNVPDNPLLTRGTVVVNGSATVINPEGHSTIWSGDEVDLGGNNTTSTEIADPSADSDGDHTSKYPDCLGSTTLDPENCDPATTTCPCATVSSSDRVTSGLDIVEQDASLANLTEGNFFLNFFGTTQNNYKNTRVTIETTAANSSQDAPTGANDAVDEVVWVDGSAGTTNWNGISVGCDGTASSNAAGMTCDGEIRPSIVIVDGDLHVAGNITIWGLLYVTGEITGNGSVDIRGAAMMEGTNGNLSGSLRIFYNSAVLKSLADNGQMGGGGGSWRDFGF